MHDLDRMVQLVCYNTSSTDMNYCLFHVQQLGSYAHYGVSAHTQPTVYSKRLGLLYLIEYKCTWNCRLRVLIYYLTCLVNYRTSRLNAVTMADQRKY